MHSSRRSNHDNAPDCPENMERSQNLGQVVTTHPNSTPSSSLSSVALGVFRAPTATYTWPPLALDGLELVGAPRFVSRPTSLSTLYHDSKTTGPIQSTGGPLSGIPSEGHSGTLVTLQSPPEESKLPATTNTSSSDGDEPGELWTQYARPLKISNATSVEWVCMWTGPGYLDPCFYQGKKQLVKRHIETKHMMIKRFICEFCDKQFAQKTSLNVHISSKHLKDEPHKCEYHGCIARYNDPARLCRHKIEVHGYVPRPTSRKKDRSPHPAAVEIYNREIE